MGNEASDFDSIVSSIAYAFFLTSRSSAAGAIPVVPVMHMLRGDLPLRTEVPWLLESVGVDAGLLTYLDDADLPRLHKCAPAPVLPQAGNT